MRRWSPLPRRLIKFGAIICRRRRGGVGGGGGVRAEGHFQAGAKLGLGLGFRDNMDNGHSISNVVTPSRGFSPNSKGRTRTCDLRVMGFFQLDLLKIISYYLSVLYHCWIWSYKSFRLVTAYFGVLNIMENQSFCATFGGQFWTGLPLCSAVILHDYMIIYSLAILNFLIMS